VLPVSERRKVPRPCPFVLMLRATFTRWDPLNQLLAGNIPPATRCSIACGYILNETTSVSPFRGQSQHRTPEQFWELLFLHGAQHYIVNSSCKKVLKIEFIVHGSVRRNNILIYIQQGARGGAVGWGTALQVGRSRVRSPMVSLEFFIAIILPTALWPWGWLSL